MQTWIGSMAKKTTSESGPDSIARVYLFAGEVDSRRTAAVNKLISAVVDPSSDGFDLEKFDGDAASAATILPAAVTMPFLSSRKVVVVDRVDKLSADDQGKIAAFIPKLGAQCCLILLSGDENPTKGKSAQASKQEAKQADEDDGTKKKAKKGLQTGLVSAVKKHGEYVSFAKMRAQDVSALLSQSIREHGKKIEQPALQALSYSLQSIPAIMEREVEKLVSYIGERDTITAADVDKVATKSPEDRVFPLIDAVAAGRSDTAVNLLTETLAASTKPDGEVLKVLALLGRHFRLLYQVKFLLTEGGVRGLGSVPEDIRAMLMNETNPVSAADWQKTRLMDQARQFSMEELKRSLRYLLTCELAVKGQSREASSPRLHLEMLVLKLSQRKSPVYR